jgi:hydrogenase-4 component B
MWIETTLPWFLPSLFVIYLISELLHRRVGHRYEDWRRFGHLAMIGASGLYLVSTLSVITLAPVSFSLPGIFGVGLFFKLELLNLHLMLLTSVVFFSVTLYQFAQYEYHSHERSYSWFFTIIYITAMAALMAKDLMAYFLAVEIMTFSTYGLIVRERDENPKVLRVGFTYIIMGVFGGLLLLSGIILLYALTGGFSWDNVVLLFADPSAPRYLVTGLFILGFLVKSAAAPFHFWLIHVYSQTPYSTNALVSGILTSLSAFGLLKIVTLIYAFSSPQVAYVTEFLSSIQIVGWLLLAIALLTMVMGMVLAVFESSIRRMLTYYALSQMGLIVLGIALATLLGKQGALGLSAALYHMVNHALNISALFMVAGILHALTHEDSMYMLGGIFKQTPLLGILALLPIFGSIGMFGFNGYASKSLVHLALIQAGPIAPRLMLGAEVLFFLVSAGSVVLFLKFFWFIFLNQAPSEVKALDIRPKWSWLALGFNGVFIVGAGLFPTHLITEFYAPIALKTYYDTSFVVNNLVQFSFSDMLGLRGMVGILSLGLSLFYLGIRFDLFHNRLPDWFNVERLFYGPIEAAFERLPTLIVQQNEHRIIRADILVYALILTLLVMALIIGLL